MPRVRGLIALVISIFLGLVAAYAVSWYLNQPRRIKPASVAAPVLSVSPKTVTFSGSIPLGMRAYSFSVDDVTGVSRKLGKGDLVDIIATSPLPGKDGGHVSRIILQGIKLLDFTLGDAAKGKRSSIGRGAKAAKSWTVSVLLTPGQATSLSAAAQTARIRLAARNTKDTKMTPAQAAAFSNVTGAGSLRVNDGELSRLIRSGLRAITIQVKDTDGICGLLRQGDRVDVIATCPFSRFASGGDISPGAKGLVTEYRMAARTLLQNVEVLATERTIEVGPGIERPVSRVTLLVSPKDAEKLAVISDATKKSIIRLVSRNIEDNQRTRTGGQELADLLTQKREYHRVEVLSGTKESTKVFFR